MRNQRILIPTDFSTASLTALEHVARTVDAKATEVVVLSVVEPLIYASSGYGYAFTDLGAVLQEQERSARTQLQRLSGRWRKRLPKLRTMMVTGFAAQSIVAVAQQVKADLIVIATHGRTGLSHLFIGSVAERVVRTAACPVLTVRSRPRAARKVPKRGAKAA